MMTRCAQSNADDGSLHGRGDAEHVSYAKRLFVLAHDRARARAAQCVAQAPEGWRVTVEPPRRSLDQNARLHARLQEIAEQCEYMGRRMSVESWKALFVSGHAIATKLGGEVLPGLEGEFVAIRESTATMSKRRAASLMEYIDAWAAENGVIYADGAAA